MIDNIDPLMVKSESTAVNENFWSSSYHDHMHSVKYHSRLIRAQTFDAMEPVEFAFYHFTT